MNIAIIPWSDAYCNNRMFDRENKNLNHDNMMLPFIEMKEFFEDSGFDVNTIDLYPDLSKVDWFLFFVFSYKWYFILRKEGLLGRIVYCNAEPEVVSIFHSTKGYAFLKKIFPYILTWNDEAIDNITIFPRNIPYVAKKNFEKNCHCPKKLLVNISSNNFSFSKKELYGERRRIIRYFRDNNPNEFGLYGGGWSKKQYPVYLGKCENKFEVYHNYKFALCLENTKNVNNYVTEKIYDCLCAGIVPIYLGAKNISEFVPAKCYIDYSQFKSISELENFLQDMSGTEYEKYIRNIEDFVDSSYWESLSGKIYAKCIKRVMDIGPKTFTVNFSIILQLHFWRVKEYLINIALGIAKRMEKRK